jgi:hypothetical protein
VIAITFGAFGVWITVDEETASIQARPIKKEGRHSAALRLEEDMKRTAGDERCSDTKAVIQGVRCDLRHSKRGTCSASRLANAFNRST